MIQTASQKAAHWSKGELCSLNVGVSGIIAVAPFLSVRPIRAFATSRDKTITRPHRTAGRNECAGASRLRQDQGECHNVAGKARRQDR